MTTSTSKRVSPSGRQAGQAQLGAGLGRLPFPALHLGGAPLECRGDGGAHLIAECPGRPGRRAERPVEKGVGLGVGGVEPGELGVVTVTGTHPPGLDAQQDVQTLHLGQYVPDGEGAVTTSPRRRSSTPH